MESKAQKAPIAEIRELMQHIEDGNYADYMLSDIRDTVDEYGLQDRSDVLESVYDVFMKMGYFSEAASFGKEYGP
jgi:hypothetical protein